MTRKVTQSEYARLRGCSRNVVSVAIRKNWTLSGVISVEKIEGGKRASYVLTVDPEKIERI